MNNLMREAMRTFSQYSQANGLYGDKYALMDTPFICGTYDNPYYAAPAIDEQGNEYTLKWNILSDYNAAVQGEEYACDWGLFYVAV